jgi:exodeoxyribonuclease-5
VERDRLVCLRNDREAGLLNGSLWDVKSCKPEEETMEMQIEIADPDIELECRAWMHHVAGREEELQGNFARRDLEEFDYGYALTGHRSQGSQWNSVYVLDESAAFGKDARSWLYTAATRAARSLVLVR